MSRTEVTHSSGAAAIVATGLGLGYLPFAPGTWGSLGGVALVVAVATVAGTGIAGLLVQLALVLVLAVAGLWSAGRVARVAGLHDPQFVVIDELSGQAMALVLGLAGTPAAALNWKYLLAGFILFRVGDIWKPFPARRAESLPGGLGIMADDWVAGLYAALVLAAARQMGF